MAEQFPDAGRASQARPAYAVVLEWVEQQLVTRALRVGDKLPGERALAERFRISRASVREAIRVLDAMGLVRSGTGSGPRAGAVVISEPSAALSWALRMHVATQALPVADVVSMRILLETQAAAAAVSTPIDDDVRAQVLARARSLVEEMDDPTLPDSHFHHCDALFHAELTRLGGNVVLSTVMTSLRDSVIEYVRAAVARFSGWSDLRQRLQREHWAILRAAEAGEHAEQARILHAHIEGFHRTVTAG